MDWLHALYLERDWVTLVAAVVGACIVMAGVALGGWVIFGHLDLVDEVCEGCGAAAKRCDSEGLPLCQECYDDLDWMEGDL